MAHTHALQSLEFHSEKIILHEPPRQSNGLTTRHVDQPIFEALDETCSLPAGDDDDIIILDQSEVFLDDVKDTLNHLINRIVYQENESSQMETAAVKRSRDTSTSQEMGALKKKVRLEEAMDNEHLYDHVFVSETVKSESGHRLQSQLKPVAAFLYHLGYDICLEQNALENSSLSTQQRDVLVKFNQTFHQNSTYSCKYCSFQTDTVHVMDYHYRTPHTLPSSSRGQDKYRCTYCTYQTFRLPELRRHAERKHQISLVQEPPTRRYSCRFCTYETDDKTSFQKHHKRCRIEQEHVRLANNLLTPIELLIAKHNAPTTSATATVKRTEPIWKSRNQLVKHNNSSRHPMSSSNSPSVSNNNTVMEPILIESDHDSESLLSLSDEDFIVSSSDDSLSATDHQELLDRDLGQAAARSKKPQKSIPKVITPVVSQPAPMTKHPLPPPPTLPPLSTIGAATANLSSLSKLLLLNGASITSYTTSVLPVKPALIPIQPKPSGNNDAYLMCNICECYVFKGDYEKHAIEKHPSLASSHSQSTLITPMTILNNATNSMNTSLAALAPASILAKSTPEPSTKILLLSTSTMNAQAITLHMLKCPWCNANLEHIDVMTGHLMRYHRMTLAAAKVVVSEQMKLQGASSGQLSLMFQQEIEQIKKEFNDQLYWKISQPKVYLNPMNNISCFVCHTPVDDVENHFLSSHKIRLITMNTIKQCCLCGHHCDKQTSSLYDHQLRVHAGVCYSSILKQFIRFEPAPSISSPAKPVEKNDHSPLATLPQSQHKLLVTHTEKKFGCRKCETSSRLFTFEELVEHLRSNHRLNVRLHRRCLFCHQTYPKGKEYNDHCLEHLRDENPSILLKRHFEK